MPSTQVIQTVLGAYPFEFAAQNVVLRELEAGSAVLYTLPMNTDVLASGSGVVAAISPMSPGSAARCVLIDHGNSIVTFYGGVYDVRVNAEDQIEAMTTLGRSGAEPVRFVMAKKTSAGAFSYVSSDVLVALVESGHR